MQYTTVINKKKKMSNCSQINNTTLKGTSTVIYDSTSLPCTNVDKCDDLNTILTKFDNVICSVTADVNSLIVEVTNLTEDLIIITGDLVELNNKLNICCPTTTTTTTVPPTTTTTTTVLNCVFDGYIISSTTTTTTTQVLYCAINGSAVAI